MNRVQFAVRELPMPEWKAKARSFILKVLKMRGKNNWELSVVFCGNVFIRDLNARYRNKDEATDILSFPLGGVVPGKDGEEQCLAGDIVISLEALKENSKFFKTPEDEELRRLFIHGILHLDGLDHKTNDKEEPMLVLQENILISLAGEHIL
ncbi:MAG: rRNA maturation RNase YbeY [Treponema sp.]|jgi:probable rRNA maturation factor|nr:rRNA maturation RNase YbeY [Treponema sp.]